MKLIPQSPKKALKAFLKQKPLESMRDVFKKNLIDLLDKISIIEQQPKDESEEHLKNNIRDFLRDTYYKDTNSINTKDKKDLVIHLSKESASDVGVIIEAKRPSNKNEMISADATNKKALYEIILYYLNERVHVGNNQLKQLVITNIYEWYIIDANFFDKYIYRNNQIKKLYDTKVNDKKDNPFFYEELAKIIPGIDVEIPCIYFNIKDYETILKDNDAENDKELIALYKILSPQHLLKIATPNDSNELNERFYKELLHIIGLEEAKEGTKNIIRRKEKNRHEASLIETAIEQINTEDPLHRLPDQSIYGNNKEEKVFNIALELCITWINRILFIKLLEGQLISYHQDKSKYSFLNTETISSFDELFKLFHKVLAVPIDKRTDSINNKFAHIPYLNSSLFEISELEDQIIKINALDNDLQLELLNTTILKDCKKTVDKLPTLDYLFKFLDAYDFASDTSGDWQKDNKTIINASVLGKVFEKINGYKDGSIFTPAFITMYMCRQSIRMSVLQKFNEALTADGKNMFDKFEDLQNYTSNHYKTEEVLKHNAIINSVHICDPAVGSGHFLVSSLNEIIAIKSELRILADENGRNIGGYEFEIINDELIITDSEGNIVEYRIQNEKPISKDVQRLQKTLFTEKQTIIENCLFGVDINQNSVKISRLRLWIELLKNAYYKEETNYQELETLPNIDINIKCGNSLLSRFALTDDLSTALKTIKYNITAYRGFVKDYKNEKNRDVKKGLQKIIDTIKNDFKTEIIKSGKDYQNWYEAKGKLDKLTSQYSFFEMTDEQKKKFDDDVKVLAEKVKKYEDILENIRTNAIYKNAFEWRFEFPEVMNDKGDFEGFDLIIGNPPYIKEYENRDAFNGLRNKECYQGKMDIWYLFGDLGLSLLKSNCNLCYIATNNWTTNFGASNFRNIVINKSQIINLTDFSAYMIFENASIQTMIMIFRKNSETDNYTFDFRRLVGEKLLPENVLNLLNGVETENSSFLSPIISRADFLNKPLTFNTDENTEILSKIKSKQNFYLIEKADKELGIKSEIANGIHHHHDVVNKDRKIILNDKYEVGTGIFVLNNKELQDLGLSVDELKLIKPQYSSKQVKKYYTNPKNDEWVIYTKSDINKLNKETQKIPINDFPKIKQHLDKFTQVITSDFKPYGLHRAREQYFFEGEKIAVLRKCSNEPIFSYSEFICYLPAAFYIIQSNRINLKYLTGLLNSKLIAFWLRKKGKMQGNAYQLDKEPLLEIPIFNPSEEEVKEIAGIVDQIITLKQQGNDTTANEAQIDALVYKLYDITPEEQAIIEGAK